MDKIPDVIMVGLAVGIFVGGSVWALAWWLSGQFHEIRGLIFTTAEKTTNNIVTKLEYHEKHDDVRFSSLDSRIVSIRDDIWDIRVRNASTDGLPVLVSSRDKND